MCDLNKIASLLIAATIPLAIVVALAGTAAALATNWYTSGGAGVVMAIAASLVGTAAGFVNGALIEAVKCQAAPCKAQADRVVAALLALSISLSALLTACIVAIFGSSIPYAGIAVSVAIGVAGATAGIALALVSGTYLPDLDVCRVAAGRATPSTVVQIQKTLGLIVGIAGVAASGLASYTGWPPPLG